MLRDIEIFEPRPTCPRCMRPPKLCWCAHLVSLETRTRVVILQHPTERHMAIGTARMASLCLPNSELRVGVDFGRYSGLAQTLSDPERPAALLYPGEGAIDIANDPPAGPITLVVVDGTWHHAQRLVRRNPMLAALPRYAFKPRAPSEYRIRREPKAAYVSTLEALAHVLGILEGDPERFEAMLVPFRAMIDAQIAYERTTGLKHRGRTRGLNKPRKPSPRSILRERSADLVCVAGEANAWPGRAWPDELIHWIAHRPLTGERLELVIAPRHPLGVGTPLQSRLGADTIANGETLEAALEKWRSFVRDSDVICAWGTHGTQLMERSGGFLPPTRLDLRKLARDERKGPAGTPLEYLAHLGGPSEEPAPLGLGRAGVRLAALVEVTRFLARA